MAAIVPIFSPFDSNLADSKPTPNKSGANVKYANGNQAIEDQSEKDQNRCICSMVNCVYETICAPIMDCLMCCCLCGCNIFCHSFSWLF